MLQFQHRKMSAFSLLYLAAFTTLLAGDSPPPLAPAGTAESDQVKVTLLKVWASKKDKPADLPRELKEHEKLLKEATQKNGCNNFRLEDKPVERKIKSGEKSEFKLPRESSLAITPSHEKAQNQKEPHWVLQCQLDELAPVKIRQTRSPILTKLKNGDEQMVLILLYEPNKK